jgi:hypothetical protein
MPSGNGTQNNTACLLLCVKARDAERHKPPLQKLVENGIKQGADIGFVFYNQSEERALFACADYFVTTRSPDTVRLAGYAIAAGAKVLSGVDEPVF